MSLIRDQIVSVGTRTGRMIQGRSEDLKNRPYGRILRSEIPIWIRISGIRPHLRLSEATRDVM
jgi:hypothetical protein